MTRPKTIRTLTVPLVLALLLVACGQKPGVHVDSGPLAAQGGGGGAAGAGGDLGEDGFAVDEGAFDEGATDDGGFDDDLAAGDPDAIPEGDADGGDAGTDGAGGGEADPGAEGGSSGGQQQEAGSSGSSGGDGGTRKPQGSDRTGVTDEAITLAIHAPVTGAAPLPSTSFEKARDLYWRWVIEEKGQKILGRSKIDVVFADDRYEPTTAVQVCRQLASRAFSVAGGGGTDQIQACGRFAGQARVPYFSAGVTEAGLDGNPWYFAASMTYKQQAPLMAQYVAKNFRGKKVGAIITQTPNFNDAAEGWERGRQQANLPYTETLRHPKGNTSWYSGYARQLHEAGTEVIFFLSSPLDYIRFAQVADDAGYDFQYVGVGVTKGLNDVLRSGCPQVGNGTFFSPFSGLDVANRLDPEFQQAARKFGVEGDDIAWALWGMNKLQHELFKRYESTFGTDLTREDFRALTESSGNIKTGVYPDVQFSQQSHFGGKAIHVLEADCGSRTYKDAGTFKTSF